MTNLAAWKCLKWTFRLKFLRRRYVSCAMTCDEFVTSVVKIPRCRHLRIPQPSKSTLNVSNNFHESFHLIRWVMTISNCLFCLFTLLINCAAKMLLLFREHGSIRNLWPKQASFLSIGDKRLRPIRWNHKQCYLFSSASVCSGNLKLQCVRGKL